MTIFLTVLCNCGFIETITIPSPGQVLLKKLQGYPYLQDRLPQMTIFELTLIFGTE